MTVYELIQVLANYPADAPVYIHGAARAWIDAISGHDDAALDAAESTDPVLTEYVSDDTEGRVVIS